MDQWVENEARVVVLVVRTYNFSLSSGLVLEVDNYYFVSILSRNNIFISYIIWMDFYLLLRTNSVLLW